MNWVICTRSYRDEMQLVTSLQSLSGAFPVPCSVGAFFYCMKTCIVTCHGHFQFYLWGLIFRNCPWNWSSYEYLTRSSGTDLIIEFILIILRAPDISDSHYSTKKLNHLQLWSASKHSQHLPHEIDFSFTNNVGFLKYLEIWKGLAQNKLLGSSY